MAAHTGTLDAELEAAARKTWLEAFPNRRNPPVRVWSEDETSEYVVVGVSTWDPGSMDFVRVYKDGRGGALVPEDQQRYRPRGLK